MPKIFEPKDPGAHFFIERAIPLNQGLAIFPRIIIMVSPAAAITNPKMYLPINFNVNFIKDFYCRKIAMLKVADTTLRAGLKCLSYYFAAVDKKPQMVQRAD